MSYKKNPLWLSGLLLLALACASNDYDKARALYGRSHDKDQVTSPEFSDPLLQATVLLENYLSRNHDDPRGTLLLWRCYLRTGNPRARAMHQNMLNMTDEIRHVLPEEIHDDDDVYMRESMVGLFEEMATIDDVEPLIDILNDDPHAAVQDAAAAVLARLQDERAIAPLLAKLSDQDEAVRSFASRSLSSFPRPEVAAALYRCVVDTSEAPEIRGNAARSVADIALDNTDIRHALTKQYESILRNSRAPLSTVLLSALILARIGEPLGYDIALAYARSQDDFLRTLAVATLGFSGNKQALPHVIAALQHDNWKLRYHAAEALGELGDRTALPSLYKILDDPSEAVRQAAQRSIEKIRSTYPED